MKVSLSWLQTYFDTPLPKAEEISDALTFHAFEIEESSGDMLDVKVLPNRAADCLCHCGLAKELSAILDISLKSDPLRDLLPKFPKTDVLTVTIEDPKKCLRYMGAVVKGVKVGPSPAWLKKALETVGQRSINNIVDATNYVMLNIGQPLHAFDAAKLTQKDGKYAIGVRNAKEGEMFTTLSNETFTLKSNVLLITDANVDSAIGIAGIKGGKAAEVTANTTDIIIESANFDGTTTRRAAQTLKLFTDASVRFQNRPSPQLAAYGMRDVLTLITTIAGGEVVGVVDEYPTRPERSRGTSVSLAKINSVLGSDFSRDEVSNVFKRLDLPTQIKGDTFVVTPHFERTDLSIPEDLVEEVGRIIGYDRVPATELPAVAGVPDQARYRGIEKIKDELIQQGFTEISTQSFAAKGEVMLANPLDKTMPALRINLDENINVALARAAYVAPLVLAPNQKPKLFEIGTTFTKEGERLAFTTSESVSNLLDMKNEPDYVPARYELGAYKPFSIYPFITRDIALWTLAGTKSAEVMNTIRENASELLVRLDQFDTFEKEGKVSYAFRLVFQSDERTLTDDEANTIMGNISIAITAKGYEVR